VRGLVIATPRISVDCLRLEKGYRKIQNVRFMQSTFSRKSCSLRDKYGRARDTTETVRDFNIIWRHRCDLHAG